MRAISAVFTISRVAEVPGEDEELLHELSVGMFPEDGCLWVLDAGDREIHAFTDYGIECLKQIIADERVADRAPKQVSPGGVSQTREE